MTKEEIRQIQDEKLELFEVALRGVGVAFQTLEGVECVVKAVLTTHYIPDVNLKNITDIIATAKVNQEKREQREQKKGS